MVQDALPSTTNKTNSLIKEDDIDYQNYLAKNWVKY